MTKGDLVRKAARGTDCTMTDVERILNATLGVIKEEILEGGRINLGGFGIFSVVTRASRTIHSRLMGNGQVAEKAVPKVIPARKAVKFKPAIHFKEPWRGSGLRKQRKERAGKAPGPFRCNQDLTS